MKGRLEIDLGAFSMPSSVLFIRQKPLMTFKRKSRILELIFSQWIQRHCPSWAGEVDLVKAVKLLRASWSSPGWGGMILNVSSDSVHEEKDSWITDTSTINKAKCRTLTPPNGVGDVEQQEWSFMARGNKEWCRQFGRQFSGFSQN